MADDERTGAAWGEVARSADGPHTMVSDLARVIMDLKARVEALEAYVNPTETIAGDHPAMVQHRNMIKLMERIAELEDKARETEGRP